PRQPLRFVLADDPGAGKTIMTGLLIKELMIRGDLQRCLIICPGNLVEQWQDELDRRFHLPFDIMTGDAIEASRSGNWFLEHPLAIARLDKLARDEHAQDKLSVPENRYDLVVIDEAHKLSASFFGKEIKATKRYLLGEKVSTLTRHFLLLTATPHNGKEEDFQLFLKLLDADRFEGRFRDGVHKVDVSDLIRRMTKEQLRTFDGRPLFPERIATTVSYTLSPEEASLYQAVTTYVRNEFNRADALQNRQRAGTVGFALTTIQRRLASSPEAIYHSLRRRRERLEHQMHEMDLARRGRPDAPPSPSGRRDDSSHQRAGERDISSFTADDLDVLDEVPDDERERIEDEILDQATAAQTVGELQLEIETLRRLEALADTVRRRGTDTKWRELAGLLDSIVASPLAQTADSGQDDPSSPRRKLIIFTEHRDTLAYLRDKIERRLGRSDAVVVIHGGMGREERRAAQETFLYHPNVWVLVATDAAGEGVNLQRANLMINYDLPWNPNRLEQRFGRIHRIGQTEVCYLWNLVAMETREGDVYYRLLEKLGAVRDALGGQVFDVLGKLQFDGRPLRDLLIEAIRYGDSPEVRDRLNRVVDHAVDIEHIRRLLHDQALSHEILDDLRIARVREDMERAAALRLQPHYIESFFLTAFRQFEGTIRKRESERYEITYVPESIRQRGRQIGRGNPVLIRYERVCFDKAQMIVPGKPQAVLLSPGHPLLDATLDLVLERYREMLKRGAILVDERDPGIHPRVLFFLDHAIHDAGVLPSGERRVISRRMRFVEYDAQGNVRYLAHAPYLDYRPLADDEPDPATILAHPDLAWITRDLERRAQQDAIAHIVPDHLREVRDHRMQWITKTRAAVRERLTKEIAYWDHRAEELKHQEQAGKPNAKLNWQEARRRADELDIRLKRRMEELDREAQIMAATPVVIGGALVVPSGLLAKITGRSPVSAASARDTQEIAAHARAIVMEIERRLGYHPVDREFERLGYDIESRDPNTGALRFIEVKGRRADADTITVTRNEILTALNAPDAYILALVAFDRDDNGYQVRYVRTPFRREPDFAATSVDYHFDQLF
ncbi:MAG: helicase-related protein, partial [Roseiflexus sp.]